MGMMCKITLYFENKQGSLGDGVGKYRVIGPWGGYVTWPKCLFGLEVSQAYSCTHGQGFKIKERRVCTRGRWHPGAL